MAINPNHGSDPETNSGDEQSGADPETANGADADGGTESGAETKADGGAEADPPAGRQAEPESGLESETAPTAETGIRSVEKSGTLVWPARYARDHLVRIAVLAVFLLYPGIYALLIDSPLRSELVALLPEVETMIAVFYFGLFAMSFDFISGYTGYLDLATPSSMAPARTSSCSPAAGRCRYSRPKRRSCSCWFSPVSSLRPSHR